MPRTTQTLAELEAMLDAGELSVLEFSNLVANLPDSNDTYQPSNAAGASSGQQDWQGQQAPDYFNAWSPQFNYWEGFDQPAQGGGYGSIDPYAVGGNDPAFWNIDPSQNYFANWQNLAQGQDENGQPIGAGLNVQIPLPWGNRDRESESGGGGGGGRVDTEGVPETPRDETGEPMTPEQKANYDKYLAMGIPAAVALTLALQSVFTGTATTGDPSAGNRTTRPGGARPPAGAGAGGGGGGEGWNTDLTPFGDVIPSPGEFSFIPTNQPSSLPNGATIGGPLDVLTNLGFPPFTLNLGQPQQQQPQQQQPVVNNSVNLGASNFPQLTYPDVAQLQPVGQQIVAQPFPFKMARR